MTKLQTTTATQTDDVFSHVMSTLVELAVHEGDIMMMDSLIPVYFLFCIAGGWPAPGF